MNDRGSAVVLAAFTMIILFFLGTALIDVSRVEFTMADNHAAEVKCYYIAEAGIEKALAQLRMDQTFLKDIMDLDPGESLTLATAESFGGGNFSDTGITLKSKDADFCIVDLECRGYFENASRAIRVQAKIFTNGLLPFEDMISIGSVDSKKGQITGSEDIIADFTFRDYVYIKTCTIIGDVTGYDVELGTSAWIQGNVNYVNSFTGNTSAVSGTITQIDAIDVKPLPVLTSAQYLAVAQEMEEVPGTRVFPGGYTGVFDLSTKSSGIYYVNGPLTVHGTYTGRITLVATGKITVDNTGISTPDRSSNVLTMVSFNEIEIGDGDVMGLLYVTPENGTEGKLSLSGNGTLIGAAIANVLDISGNIQLQFDADLANQCSPGVPAVIQINYWRETTDVVGS